MPSSLPATVYLLMRNQCKRLAPRTVPDRGGNHGVCLSGTSQREEAMLTGLGSRIRSSPPLFRIRPTLESLGGVSAKSHSSGGRLHLDYCVSPRPGRQSKPRSQDVRPLIINSPDPSSGYGWVLHPQLSGLYMGLCSLSREKHIKERSDV